MPNNNNNAMQQLQKEVQQLTNNLSALRTASEQAKKSAQSASTQIRTIEKIDAASVFDKQFNSIARSASRSFNAAIEDFVINGDSFKSVFRKLGANLLRSTLSGLPFGNIAASVLPFARGGVLNGPAFFPVNRQIGLAGEAGPEAIMPLARGADGKLGVRAQNDGARAIHVNVNITTPDAQSFRQTQTQISGMLRRAIARGQRNL